MPLNRKISGGLLAMLGFMLSPLTWWNDAFVNLPVAVAFAWLVSFFCTGEWKSAVFQTAVVLGYWLTNVVGLVLLHKGTRDLVRSEPSPVTSSLKRDILVSLGYTALIVLLIKLGLLKPLEDYFNSSSKL